jgi:hypothetical protein
MNPKRVRSCGRLRRPGFGWDATRRTRPALRVGRVGRRSRRTAEGLHWTDSRPAGGCEGLRHDAAAETGRVVRATTEACFGCRAGGLARTGDRSGRRDGCDAACGETRGAVGHRWSDVNGFGLRLGAAGQPGDERRRPCVGARRERHWSRSASVDGGGSPDFWNPGGERSPWKERARAKGNPSVCYGPDSGARPRSRGSPMGDSVRARSGIGGATAGGQRPW